jgi:hypothetical protein
MTSLPQPITAASARNLGSSYPNITDQRVIGTGGPRYEPSKVPATDQPLRHFISAPAVSSAPVRRRLCVIDDERR